MAQHERKPTVIGSVAIVAGRRIRDSDAEAGALFAARPPRKDVEISAIQEIATFDADGGGQPDRAEAAPYHEAQCHKLSEQTAPTANGPPLARPASVSDKPSTWPQ
jgi:hypothetical protein